MLDSYTVFFYFSLKENALKKIPHPRKEDFELCSVLSALSDPVRLSIVKELLGRGECNCSFFCGYSLAKSTMSHHFKVLRESGLIMTTIKGTEYIHSVRKDELDSMFPGVLDSVLKSYDKRKR